MKALAPLRVEQGQGRWAKYWYLKDSTGTVFSSTNLEERAELMEALALQFNELTATVEQHGRLF